jgi:hypothetical protein
VAGILCLLSVFFAGTAAASCPITADQVAVYVDPNQGGNCKVLGPGFYPTPASFGLPDNSISSVVVGANVNVTLFRDSPSGGTWQFNESSQTFYGAGDVVGSLSGFDNVVSAIEVASRGSTEQVAHTFLGNNPNRYGSEWGTASQGLAHDANYWYITKTDRIYKYPLTSTLTGTPTASVDISTALAPLNCKHFGDLDVQDSPTTGQTFLFVPLEQCTGTWAGALVVAVLDTSLHLVTYDSLFAPEQAGHAAWLAFQPSSGHNLLFSSTEHVTASTPLVRYELDWDNIYPDPAGHYILYAHTDDFVLNNESPNGPSPSDIANVQGGVFSDDGSVFYLSNGANLHSAFGSCPSSRDGNGIHAFRTSDFQRIAQSSNGIGAFNLENHPCDWFSLDEVEGIDFLNMNGSGGAFQGSLHAMLFSNYDPSIYLKHYR